MSCLVNTAVSVSVVYQMSAVSEFHAVELLTENASWLSFVWVKGARCCLINYHFTFATYVDWRMAPHSCLTSHVCIPAMLIFSSRHFAASQYWRSFLTCCTGLSFFGPITSRISSSFVMPSKATHKNICIGTYIQIYNDKIHSTVRYTV